MPVDVANSRRDGSKSVLKFIRQAIRVWRSLGSLPVFGNPATNATFVGALIVLEGVIAVFEAIDDNPFEIDPNDGSEA